MEVSNTIRGFEIENVKRGWEEREAWSTINIIWGNDKISGLRLRPDISDMEIDR